MKRVAMVFLAACGAKQSATAPIGTQSECSKVARHISMAAFGWTKPPPTTEAKIVQVITEHCEQDRWSAQARSCFGSITDEASSKRCEATLTKEQHDNVNRAMESAFDMQPAAPTASPAEPAKGADPCEGGE